MFEPTTPTAGRPPDPHFALHFARRLWQSGVSLDRATGFVDALGDVLSQVAKEYGDRLASRVHVASYVSQELRALGEELQSMQTSFLVWYRIMEVRRREMERREAKRRERRRMRRRGKK